MASGTVAKISYQALRLLTVLINRLATGLNIHATMAIQLMAHWQRCSATLMDPGPLRHGALDRINLAVERCLPLTEDLRSKKRLISFLPKAVGSDTHVTLITSLTLETVKLLVFRETGHHAFQNA